MALTERLPNGDIETIIAVGDGVYADGDGSVVLKPGDKGYDELDDWLKARGE